MLEKKGKETWRYVLWFILSSIAACVIERGVQPLLYFPVVVIILLAISKAVFYVRKQ